MVKLTTLGYVGVAKGLGAVVGFERELADKPAGMRTHMLVGGAASLLFTAAVGVSVALHEILIATGATLLALATLRVARFVETRMGSKPAESHQDSETRPTADNSG
ncbi:MAG: MgtC/SapB family protein [Verrucomicrobia bacterium]|nr:MgtC/SapB family protein [Verrucomicrobiota bacterium]